MNQKKLNQIQCERCLKNIPSLTTNASSWIIFIPTAKPYSHLAMCRTCVELDGWIQGDKHRAQELMYYWWRKKARKTKLNKKLWEQK